MIDCAAARLDQVLGAGTFVACKVSVRTGARGAEVDKVDDGASAFKAASSWSELRGRTGMLFRSVFDGVPAAPNRSTTSDTPLENGTREV